MINKIMTIFTDNGFVVQNVEPLIDANQINDKIILYYEIGFKIDETKGVVNGNWIRTNKFKQISKPLELKEMDTRLSDSDYIRHHNFMYKLK